MDLWEPEQYGLIYTMYVLRDTHFTSPLKVPTGLSRISRNLWSIGLLGLSPRSQTMKLKVLAARGRYRRDYRFVPCKIRSCSVFEFQTASHSEWLPLPRHNRLNN